VWKCSLAFNIAALGGLVVIVLAVGPNVREFNPAEDDRFLRAIKIRSTTPFAEEVKREGPMS
jgi:hypothetical protein